ncbi:2Fe-2S iron-sulfur cluster-binding protein [Streptomyces albidoflavus]
MTAASTTLSLRVLEVVRETRDAVSVRFAPPPGESPLDFRPGQFLTLRVPVPGGGWAARCYSLSSTPGDGPPTITVKRVPGGVASTWLCEALRQGDEIRALPPAGVFVAGEEHRNLLLLAAGSGITPVMSVLRERLGRTEGTVVLVYANRDEESVIFARELRELAARHQGRLVVLHHLESLQGLPTADVLTHLCRGHVPDTDLAMVCGPQPFMDACAQALTALELPRKKLLTERYRSLESDPFATPSDGGPPLAPAEDRTEATAVVEMDGERREFTWPAGATLLDVLLERGVEAPFSCKEGACSACACRILSGEVELRRNEVLDEQDLAEGYILACQAVPAAERIEVSYDQ